MIDQSNTKSQKTNLSIWKKAIIGGCSTVILCSLCIIGLSIFALWGGGGEPATLAVATKVDQKFIQAIHTQEIDLAYGMLSEKFSPKISKEQFTGLLQKDQKIFSTYKTFDICDWGFFISDGRVITSSGLLSYDGGKIVVEISLHKDTDSVWRVQGFKFRPERTPKPFGLCK